MGGAAEVSSRYTVEWGSKEGHEFQFAVFVVEIPQSPCYAVGVDLPQIVLLSNAR